MRVAADLLIAVKIRRQIKALTGPGGRGVTKA